MRDGRLRQLAKHLCWQDTLLGQLSPANSCLMSTTLLQDTPSSPFPRRAKDVHDRGEGGAQSHQCQSLKVRRSKRVLHFSLKQHKWLESEHNPLVHLPTAEPHLLP